MYDREREEKQERERNAHRRGHKHRHHRNGDRNHPRSWDRNLDDSRGSDQRESQQARSFGYGDDFPHGDEGNYLSSRDRHDSNRDRHHDRYFHPMDESYVLPTANFGGVTDTPYYERRGLSQYRDRDWRDQPHRHAEGEGFWESTKKFFGIGPKGWKRSDERIREDVCEALAHHPDIDASEMEVEVKERIVSLKGTVESRSMKRHTEEVVERVSGVEDVRNELQVKRAEPPYASPSEPRSNMQ